MSGEVGGSVTRMEKLPKAKCRLWRLRLTSGGRQLESRRFRGSYTAARAALARYVNEYELRPELGKATFGEYAGRWLERRRRGGEIADQTLSRDANEIKRLEPAFGSVRLADLDRQAIQDGLLDIREGRYTGRPLSGTTMNKCFNLMKQVLKQAALDNMIPFNPMDSLAAPRKDTKERKAVDAADVRRVLAMLEERPLDAHTMGVRLMLLAGLRRSEAVGLEWRDVSDGMIRVGRSVAELTGEVKPPKSAAGFRSIPMMPQLQTALEAWSMEQARQLDFLGIPQTPETPVLTNSKGKRMPAQNMWRWWNRRRGELGLDCTLHELRHTFLTMLGNSGASLQAIKSIAGWSSIGMARIYVHDDEEANRAAVDQLTRRLGGGAS